jgi:aminopeptidase-like protein
MIPEFLAKIKKNFPQGPLVKMTLEKIHSSDRFFSFDHFEKTAFRVADLMKKSGLVEIELIPFRADGKTKYGDWAIPPYWEVEEAQLKIIEPVEEELANYGDNPASLIMFSSPTPPEGWRGEVVLLEEGENTKNSSLRGKIVFTSQPPHEVEEEVLRAGAVGIISDSVPANKIEGRKSLIPSATVWWNDCFAYFKKTTGFGFSLSPIKGKFLRSLLQGKNTVRVEAKVKTRFKEGTLYGVVGVVPGREKEEILATAHLYEPGANDNASGVAVLLETARTLQEISPLKRRVRFFFSFELFGVMAYVYTHQEKLPSILAGLNLDMVGEDQERTKSTLHLIPTPPPQPHFSNFLLTEIVKEVHHQSGGDFRWQLGKFDLLDNLISDPMVNIPTPSLMSRPDLFYHTSLDQPDKVSEKMLEKVGWMAGAYLYFLAQAGQREARWLIEKIFQEAKNLFSASSTPAFLVYQYQQLKKTLLSTLQLLEEEEKNNLKKLIEQKLTQLPVVKPSVHLDSAAEEGKVPQRVIFGPLSMFDLSEEGKQELAAITEETFPWNKTLNYLLFWTDGKRRIEEIFQLVKQERKKITLEFVKKFFQFLEKYGYVKMKSPSSQPRKT